MKKKSRAFWFDWFYAFSLACYPFCAVFVFMLFTDRDNLVQHLSKRLSEYLSSGSQSFELLVPLRLTGLSRFGPRVPWGLGLVKLTLLASHWLSPEDWLWYPGDFCILSILLKSKILSNSASLSHSKSTIYVLLCSGI